AARAVAAAPTPPATSPLEPVPPPQHLEINCGPWPHQDAIEFGALPGAVPCARLHARHVLSEWGLARQAADAELLVSELVTNAIAASRFAEYPSPVRLWLRADRIRVLILVWNASPQPPVPADGAQDDESRSGLLLGQAISQRWTGASRGQAEGKVGGPLAGPASTGRFPAGPSGHDRTPAPSPGPAWYGPKSVPDGPSRPRGNGGSVTDVRGTPWEHDPGPP